MIILYSISYKINNKLVPNIRYNALINEHIKSM